MAKRKQRVSRRERRLLGKEDARTKAAAKDIEKWLASYGDALIREAISDLRGKGKRKSVTKAELTDRQKKLLAILRRHGFRQMQEAGLENSKGFRIPKRTAEAYIREKEILVQRLDKKIEREFKRALAGAMSRWMGEKPTPSMGEIGRRIRTNFFIKPEGERDEGLEAIPEEDGGIGLVRTVHGRAELIARTEIGNARAQGRIEGMKAAGVKWKKWVAVTGDKKSGDRKHWEMNGVVIPIDEKFELPRIKGKKRDRMMSPKIGPIHQIANCRCRVVATRQGPKK
ncbi:hypothetical protein CMI37_18095 [Candidatus Pacearchaeota archaeon]|nr:hypothetical protein [Candidatus Pacearchaeota archaeon]|tara:strand:- start:2007 stop:2858 length:852 start_codon:yes stop_codon:yes gene_type:complete